MVSDLRITELKQEYDYIMSLADTYDKLKIQHNKAIMEALKGIDNDKQKEILKMMITR